MNNIIHMIYLKHTFLNIHIQSSRLIMDWNVHFLCLLKENEPKERALFQRCSAGWRTLPKSNL